MTTTTATTTFSYWSRADLQAALRDLNRADLTDSAARANRAEIVRELASRRSVTTLTVKGTK